MYERSAIVLERYIEKILELNKPGNLRENSEKYSELVREIEDYQVMAEKELKVIQEFDDTAKKIQDLQQEQERIYNVNSKLEEDRAQLFTDLGEDARTLEMKLKKIENSLDRNNEKSKEIREEFIQYLTDFSQKQKDRNKCEKARRIGEANHIEYIKKMDEAFHEIEVKDVVNLKDFINAEKEQIKQDVLNIMTKNGKNEKVAFNQDVLRKAINARMDIAEKEAECYVLIYDRMKRLLAETDSEEVRLTKYQKVLKDTSVKLAFLKAQKEYIVGFLDYERMTAISGTRAHNKMMVEACNNFELDMMQIKNLYELILRETANKASNKAYKELYNKTYLKNIEDKEKNFEEEVNHVNISMGTVINSNYWRIEGIKNIYRVFQEEVTEKFGRDLSEYRIEELEEEEIKETYEFEDSYEDDDEEDDDIEDVVVEEKKTVQIEDYDYADSIDDDYDEEDDEEDEYDEEQDEEDDDDEDEEEEEDKRPPKRIKKQVSEKSMPKKNTVKKQTKKKNEDLDEDLDIEDLDRIIENSRKKTANKSRKKDNKGIFDKFFNKKGNHF